MEGGVSDLGRRRTLPRTAKRRRRRTRRRAPPDVRRQHPRPRRALPLVSYLYVRPQLRLRDGPRLPLPRRRPARPTTNRHPARIRRINPNTSPVILRERTSAAPADDRRGFWITRY